MLKRHALLIAILAVLAPIYAIWMWVDGLTAFGGDAAYYLMMAQSYASPADALDPVIAAASQRSRFPPLYPALLALFGGADSFHVAQELTAAFLMVALLALYVWQLQERISRPFAVAVILVVALMPQTYMAGLSPQSEYLYLLLSLLSLMALAHHHKTGTLPWLLAASLMIAAAIMTRTIGVTLLPPLLLAAYRMRRPLASACVLLAAGPVAIWLLVHHSNTSYASSLHNTYGSGPFLDALWAQLATESAALYEGFSANFLNTTRLSAVTLSVGVEPARHAQLSFAGVVILVLGAALLTAALLRAWQLRADGLYVCAYLALLLIWPFPEDAARFLWVVIPVALVQFGLLLGSPGPTWRSGSTIATVVVALMLILVFPSVVFTIGRYENGLYSDIEDARHYLGWYELDAATAENDTRLKDSIRRGYRRIALHVSADECVFNIKPQLVNYYAHRRSIMVPFHNVPEAEYTRALFDVGCHYLYMVNFADVPWRHGLEPAEFIRDRIHTIERGEVLYPPDPEPKTSYVIGKLLQ